MNYEEQDFQTEKVNLKTWKKIIETVFKSKKNVFLMVMFVVILSLLDAVTPLLNRYAIDVFFREKEFSTLVPFVILNFLVALGFGLSVWGFIYQAGKIEVAVNYELRKQSFETLQRLPFAYFDKTPQGWIMARMTSDSRKLANVISWGVVDLLWSFVVMVTILIVMFVLEWRLALIVTTAIPVMALVAWYFRKRILVHYREARKINSQVTASYNESFMGAKTTKSLAIEAENYDEFNAKTGLLRRANVKAVFFQSIFSPIMLLISYIVIAFVSVQGGNEVLKLAISVGTLYAFIEYSVRFFEPIMQISRILAQFQQAQASAERVIQLIETKPEITDSPEVVEKYGDLLNPKYDQWEPIEGDVEFKDVTFHYLENEIILQNFNLKVKKGTSVALVGHTGSGKTTIINLLSRFYEPKQGEILIDGVNYKERSMHWLHKRLGYVLQTPHLFSGTIMENIRYGRLDATDEQVIEAAKAIGADEFISQLDKGYLSEVGEGGNKLSTGQKQLISFARAILADPRLLILDEATSSIDSESEQIIQQATDQLLKGRTSFIVAHRLSTIVKSDLIVYLSGGKIIEQGDHRTLLEKRGAYFELYKRQFLTEQQEKMEKAL
ncbi:ABC transporter ATP-binding protein/permease [Acholeplasma manati]|uniref:ABC transporter ATP-binding protein/permease n=1 Tax=Paracholeplasma manati TaxID=591373 RepID=A0ABT2Y4Q8_9MOLU|nr:ABC transporter ATP-binding protein [Paracholeplasma manati]MCV2231727.1 ABC transporter ATP-binding protein/permease [Paracholeplasma manati]